MGNTQENLMAAFAGESQANRKYLAFAKKAEAEGKTNIAKLFRAAAEAETIHALREFELAGGVGTTEDNLKAAISGETYEYTVMYPEFLETAEKEGQQADARAFGNALKAEASHAELFTKALESGDEAVTYYLCPVCGEIETQRPDKCPVCGVPGEKFIEF